MLKKWNSLSLVVRIGIGLIIGAILGLTLPGLTWIGVLGKLFVGALKAIAPLLVFVLVSSSLANARGGNMKKFRTVIFLYLFSTQHALCRDRSRTGQFHPPGLHYAGRT